MAARQPIQQQALAQRAAYHSAFGVRTWQVYDQMRAGLVTTRWQARCVQCAH